VAGSIVEQFRRSKQALQRVRVERAQITADVTGTVAGAAVAFANGFGRTEYPDMQEFFGIDSDLILGLGGAAAVMMGAVSGASAGLVLNGARALIDCAGYRLGEQTAKDMKEDKDK
jgi:hypothetical protein